MGDRHYFSILFFLSHVHVVFDWDQHARATEEMQQNSMHHTRMKGATMRILSGFVILPGARIFCLVSVQCGFSCLTVPGLTIGFNAPVDKQPTARISETVPAKQTERGIPTIGQRIVGSNGLPYLLTFLDACTASSSHRRRGRWRRKRSRPAGFSSSIMV